ncbi:hypothetical protein, partial [Acidocella sp. KAb 2-4]|uniref:hypothetical protein n=1 Tax=Acidocella sp. KAb 2-4 TaxID=2885158 RepID=UPI001D06997F
MAVLTGEDLASLPVLRAQLRAAGAARSLRRAGVQELALRLGALRTAGVAPMLARRLPKPGGRAGEASGGIAPLAPMRRAATRGAALAAVSYTHLR